MEGAPVKQAAAVAVIRPAAKIVADSAVAVTRPAAEVVADSVVAVVAPEPAEALVADSVVAVAAATAGLEPTTFVFSTELEPGHRPGFF